MPTEIRHETLHVICNNPGDSILEIEWTSLEEIKQERKAARKLRQKMNRAIKREREKLAAAGKRLAQTKLALLRKRSRG